MVSVSGKFFCCSVKSLLSFSVLNNTSLVSCYQSLGVDFCYHEFGLGYWFHGLGNKGMFYEF